MRVNVLFMPRAPPGARGTINAAWICVVGAQPESDLRHVWKRAEKKLKERKREGIKNFAFDHFSNETGAEYDLDDTLGSLFGQAQEARLFARQPSAHQGPNGTPDGTLPKRGPRRRPDWDTSATGTRFEAWEDEALVEGRSKGLQYPEICKKYGIKRADSSLRNRWRTLQKNRNSDASQEDETQGPQDDDLSAGARALVATLATQSSHGASTAQDQGTSIVSQTGIQSTQPKTPAGDAKPTRSRKRKRPIDTANPPSIENSRKRPRHASDAAIPSSSKPTQGGLAFGRKQSQLAFTPVSSASSSHGKLPRAGRTKAVLPTPPDPTVDGEADDELPHAMPSNETSQIDDYQADHVSYARPISPDGSNAQMPHEGLAVGDGNGPVGCENVDQPAGETDEHRPSLGKGRVDDHLANADTSQHFASQTAPGFRTDWRRPPVSGPIFDDHVEELPRGSSNLVKDRWRVPEDTPPPNARRIRWETDKALLHAAQTAFPFDTVKCKRAFEEKVYFRDLAKLLQTKPATEQRSAQIASLTARMDRRYEEWNVEDGKPPKHKRMAPTQTQTQPDDQESADGEIERDEPEVEEVYHGGIQGSIPSEEDYDYLLESGSEPHPGDELNGKDSARLDAYDVFQWLAGGEWRSRLAGTKVGGQEEGVEQRQADEELGGVEDGPEHLGKGLIVPVLPRSSSRGTPQDDEEYDENEEVQYEVASSYVAGERNELQMSEGAARPILKVEQQGGDVEDPQEEAGDSEAVVDRIDTQEDDGDNERKKAENAARVSIKREPQDSDDGDYREASVLPEQKMDAKFAKPPKPLQTKSEARPSSRGQQQVDQPSPDTAQLPSPQPNLGGHNSKSAYKKSRSRRHQAERRRSSRNAASSSAGMLSSEV
ncbi:hypothetical protein B0A50_05647 [Salinomyces thailandicus]|uniref:Uncharacterized protein n=1 Tax=Salinomyces thailandicus TaxID=706561 RepID=A0A4U0TV79_9PEZI|nr:hypothetical protein B0A50_05647 [Salinomyces thailandica]